MIRRRRLAAAGLAFAGWASAFGWLYDAPTWVASGPPPGWAWAVFLLPAAAACGVAAVRALRTGPEPSRALVAALFLAVSGAAWGGAAILRERQQVAASDLGAIRLERRAAPGGERPLSNIRLQVHGNRRTVALLGSVVNGNAFRVWEVDLALDFYKEGHVALSVPIRLRADLAAGASAQVAWAGSFRTEELPSAPSWDVRVLSARRHWGGVPRASIATIRAP